MLGPTKFQADKAFFILIGALISTIHIDLFYYAFDTPKWYLFDISLAGYIFINRFYLRTVNLSFLGLLTSAFILSSILLSFIAPHIGMAVEFVYRLILSACSIYLLNQKYSGKQLHNLLLITVVGSTTAFIMAHLFERYILERPYNVGSFSTFGFINNIGQVFNIWIPILVLSIFKYRNSLIAIALLIPLTVYCISILMEASVRGCIFGLFLGEAVVFMIMLYKDAKKAILFLSTSAALLLGIASYTYFDDLEGGN